VSLPNLCVNPVGLAACLDYVLIGSSGRKNLVVPVDVITQ
jgi:hypothetical protein